MVKVEISNCHVCWVCSEKLKDGEKAESTIDVFGELQWEHDECPKAKTYKN